MKKSLLMIVILEAEMDEIKKVSINYDNFLLKIR